MNIAKQVHDIFIDCLFRDDEIKDGMPKEGEFIKAKGIMGPIGFHPGRIKGHVDEIENILNLMPKAFHKSGGGGYTFLNLCATESGEQWGEQPTVNELVCLGLAVGMVSYPMPREMWPTLPGGVPYVTIDTNKEKNTNHPTEVKK